LGELNDEDGRGAAKRSGVNLVVVSRAARPKAVTYPRNAELAPAVGPAVKLASGGLGLSLEVFP
jgi:hypothetical protein